MSKEKNIYKPIKKHKENSNTKDEIVITEKNNIDVKTYNIKEIYNELSINDEEIKISKTLFNNQIYENEFFDIIPIMVMEIAFIEQYNFILIRMKINILI